MPLSSPASPRRGSQRIRSDKPVQWVRVRDEDTGHEFDVRPQSIRPGRNLTELVDYPPNRTSQPRSPKHAVAKDGRPSSTRRAAPAPADSEGVDQQ